MTTEQQRIAIAEVCGWKNVHRAGPAIGMSNSLVGNHPDTSTPMVVPCFPSDLNAMHEAENSLTDEQHNVFKHKLSRIVGFSESRHAYSQPGWRRRYISSTSAQRCEAFLKTIGKWTEEPSAN